MGNNFTISSWKILTCLLLLDNAGIEGWIVGQYLHRLPSSQEDGASVRWVLLYRLTFLGSQLWSLSICFVVIINSLKSPDTNLSQGYFFFWCIRFLRFFATTMPSVHKNSSDLVLTMARSYLIGIDRINKLSNGAILNATLSWLQIKRQ